MCSVRCWQLVHCDASVSPTAEEYVPPGQGRHAAEPSSGAYVPAGQMEHAADDVAADAFTRYVPSSQGEQYGDPAPAKYPGGHLVHVPDAGFTHVTCTVSCFTTLGHGSPHFAFHHGEGGVSLHVLSRLHVSFT